MSEHVSSFNFSWLLLSEFRHSFNFSLIYLVISTLTCEQVSLSKYQINPNNSSSKCCTLSIKCVEKTLNVKDKFSNKNSTLQIFYLKHPDLNLTKSPLFRSYIKWPSIFSCVLTFWRNPNSALISFDFLLN